MGNCHNFFSNKSDNVSDPAKGGEGGQKKGEAVVRADREKIKAILQERSHNPEEEGYPAASSVGNLNSRRARIVSCHKQRRTRSDRGRAPSLYQTDPLTKGNGWTA